MALELEQAEAEKLVAATKKAALALAEVWDLLHDFEEKYNVEIAGADEMVGRIAAELPKKPNAADLKEWNIEMVLGELDVFANLDDDEEATA